MVTDMTKKWRMLSPWAVGVPRGDRKDQKMCMLSPWAVGVPRSDRKDQKDVHVVTMGCWRTSR